MRGPKMRKKEEDLKILITANRIKSNRGIKLVVK
jgi:hypothetical protein